MTENISDKMKKRNAQIFLFEVSKRKKSLWAFKGLVCIAPWGSSVGWWGIFALQSCQFNKFSFDTAGEIKKFTPAWQLDHQS